MWILWLFFAPVFIVLAIVATAVFGGLVIGTIHFWPVFLIMFGLWLLFRGGGHGRQRDWRADWCAAAPRSASPAPSPPPAPAPRPTRPTGSARGQLPIDLQVKVEQIKRKVDVLLSYANRFPPFSHELYLVRQTADDYLPRTINAFLSMPSAATDQPLAGQTRTARDELKAQLDLLDAELDEIAERLLSNRRFLEDRFGSQPAHSG
jgi:hypothetical protein